jgi:hypothetical protein
MCNLKIYKLQHTNRLIKKKNIEEDDIIYKTEIHKVEIAYNHIHISLFGEYDTQIEYCQYLYNDNGCIFTTPKNEIYISCYRHPLLKYGYIKEDEELWSFDFKLNNVQNEHIVVYITKNVYSKQFTLQSNINGLQDIKLGINVDWIFLLNDNIIIESNQKTYILTAENKVECIHQFLKFNHIKYLYHVNKWFVQTKTCSYVLDKKGCDEFIKTKDTLFRNMIEEEDEKLLECIYICDNISHCFYDYHNYLLYVSGSRMFICRTKYPFELCSVDNHITKSDKIMKLNYDGNILSINTRQFIYEYGL